VNATTLIRIQWEKFEFLVEVVGHQDWGFHPETMSPKDTLIGWNSWRGISPCCLRWHGMGVQINSQSLEIWWILFQNSELSTCGFSILGFKETSHLRF
jgi:hypothetical protein